MILMLPLIPVFHSNTLPLTALHDLSLSLSPSLTTARRKENEEISSAAINKRHQEGKEQKQKGTNCWWRWLKVLVAIAEGGDNGDVYLKEVADG
ncbi:hypothetical protein L2E82_01814 [Cichorium intybus]|uniref:Uncharacterized protein n=1 Tax=Cichorium intybus TaxID=13427 RepID=A0ACB9GZX1_CICIN|nr:hypothetical protein L2E82_01814 [Cichorium intybus]